jgi:hypothetical protein
VVLCGCGRFGFGSGTGSGSDDAAPPGDITRPMDAIDAPADVPDAPSLLSCTGTFVCDGFDSGTLSTVWMLDTQGGTVTFDTTQSHRGGSSLLMHLDQVTSSTTNPRALIVTYQGLPITGTIYTRAWFRFSSPMPTSPFAQIINYANTAGMGLSVGEASGKVTNNEYTTGGYMQSATPLPLNTWTCLQFEAPSGISSTVRVRVDGTELTDIALPSASPQPAPNHLYIGLEWVGTLTSQPAFDVWMDDVIMSTSPTTCAQ